MIVIRILFLPFTLLYALGIALRQLLYKSGVYTRTQFDFPIICVGNLSVGGTGKTPHIEWLIRAFRDVYKIAILSRGYKRKTTGYVLANIASTPATIGDEPFQIKQKFGDLTVAVCENRVLGVPNLLADVPETQMILMDDGFQHLPIKPGYSIILTDYNNLYTEDWPLPSGTLREFRSGAKRARCIIVSKCPRDLTEAQQQEITRKINPLPGQLVLFSTLSYGELQPVYPTAIHPDPSTTVLAFSGIARNELFIKELESRYTLAHQLNYRDHKDYDAQTLTNIATAYKAIASPNKIIVTTEKDAVKLNTWEAQSILGNLPVYYLPIQVEFFENMGEQLLASVREFTEQMLLEEE
jgi:tetraacyldisaccharide 4'-kinase